MADPHGAERGRRGPAAGGEGPAGTGPRAGRRHRLLRRGRRPAHGGVQPVRPGVHGRPDCWPAVRPGWAAGQRGRRTTRAHRADTGAGPAAGPGRRRLAYVSAGALRVAVHAGAGADADEADEKDRAVAEPADEPGVYYGLAEHIAAEEMGRLRGYWWAPDGRGAAGGPGGRDAGAALVHLRPGPPGPDPGRDQVPGRGHAERGRLAAAGGPGRRRARRSSGTGPRSSTWSPRSGRRATTPLIVVLNRDQNRAAAPHRGPGHRRDRRCCARTPTRSGWTSCRACRPGPADGRLVWSADVRGAKRLVVGTPGRAQQRHGRAGHPAQPPGPATSRRSTGTRCCSPRPGEPTEIGLWSYGPGGLTQVSAATAGLNAGRPGRRHHRADPAHAGRRRA